MRAGATSAAGAGSSSDGVTGGGAGVGAEAGVGAGARGGRVPGLGRLDLDGEHLGHAADVVGDRRVFMIAGDPRVDLLALELLDHVRRRRAGEDLAVVAERGQNHVRTHGRHQHAVVERDRHAEHLSARFLRREHRGMVERVEEADASHLLLRGPGPHERAQPCDQRRRIERLLPVGLDRLRRSRQRVQAGEHGVDRLDRQAVGSLAQQLEDVLHRVRQLRDGAEAHRRAHALERVRDAEDLVDRGAVLGVLLESNDREVQLFEMLARLGDEHRHVLGGIHQDFR